MSSTTSPWNTPLLPVLKADTQHFPSVQDLRDVNTGKKKKNVKLLHGPKLACSLKKIYKTLVLKCAFFCLTLALVTQPIFAFGWTDSESGYTSQLIWTWWLLKGFKNLPILFDEALSANLLEFRQKYPQSTLVLCVDDFLIVSPMEEDVGQQQKAFEEPSKPKLQSLGQKCSAVSHSGHMS